MIPSSIAAAKGSVAEAMREGIASATEPFAAAIEDGISGFLARGGGWGTALAALASSGRRREMGMAGARACVSQCPAVVIPQAVVAALGLPVRG